MPKINVMLLNICLTYLRPYENITYSKFLGIMYYREMFMCPRSRTLRRNISTFPIWNIKAFNCYITEIKDFLMNPWLIILIGLKKKSKNLTSNRQQYYLDTLAYLILSSSLTIHKNKHHTTIKFFSSLK